MESLDVVHNAAGEEEKKNDDVEVQQPPHQPLPEAIEPKSHKHHANRHITAFLALQEQQQQQQQQQNESSVSSSSSSSNSLQVVTDGSLLSLEQVRNGTLSLQYPILIQDTPQSIGMKVPSSMTTTSTTTSNGGSRLRTNSAKQKNKSAAADNSQSQSSQSNKCLQLLCDILGPAYPIHVIDVEHQEELDGWTLHDLLEYWQDPDRSRPSDSSNTDNTGTSTSSSASSTDIGTGTCQQQQHPQTAEAPLHSKSPPVRIASGGARRTAPRRKAAVKAADEASVKSRPRVLNQISLEFSHTPLRQQVQSPGLVRDLDWIDIAWKPMTSSSHTTTSSTIQHDYTNDGGIGGSGTVHQDPAAQTVPYPQVQYYCLTSSEGCYTDFHVDFGGTSVWYHILSGEKLFCLVPPLDANVQVYEDWLCRVNQATTFFPALLQSSQSSTDTTDTDSNSGLVMVTLKAHQTLLIPSGWIHAVYTAKDSIVFGGNYLHGLDIERQIDIHSLEVRTRVPERFRFPLFRELHFAAASMYLQKMRRGLHLAAKEMEGLPALMETLELWWKGYQHEEEKVAAAMAAINDNVNNTNRHGPPPTITITSTAIQAAQQNQCGTVAEFLAALRAEHACVVETGCGPSPLLSPSLPKTVGSSNVDKPVHVHSSGTGKGPAAPRLRLKLSSAVAAAAAAATAARGLTSASAHPPKTEVSSIDDEPQSLLRPGSPRLRLKLSTSAAATATSCLMTGTQQPNSAATSSFCQQESEEGSSPFRINISVNSSQPHAAPPVSAAVSRSIRTKTKREDVDWYVDEGVDVRDEEWKPSKRSKDPSASPKQSQRVGTTSPASSTQPKIHSQRVGTTSRAPSPQRVMKKKTTARQRLSKRLGR